MMRLIHIFVLFMILVNSPFVVAGEARIAVASNFTNAIEAIAKRFEQQRGDKLIFIFGGTGKIYAQIINGAPFDAFFAADIRRPALLEQQRIALPGSRFTYAEGQLVLFSPKPNYVDANGAVLKKRAYRYLAIANPKLAPYGEAAQQVLQKLGLWNSLRFQLVRGENIGQAYQFVKSGNAELGFVAWSQIKWPNQPISGSYWKVPAPLYQPIKQQAVLLSNNSVAKAFLEFVQTDEAMAILQGFGYRIPKP
jgi:molybdate transport system substrate-binding protein